MKFIRRCLLSSLCLLILTFNVFAGAIKILPPPEVSQQELNRFTEWKLFYSKLPENTSPEIKHLKAEDKNSHYLNELILSSSPYLRQHAHNPVNWKPWTQQILKKAKDSNKLIFLSIGYSTCHWCHVMEKESFSDFEIASLLNRDFISIKVDREELPDIDDYYTAALEHVKGSAGWPISVIINSDGLPIFIDSYLSKESLTKLLTKVDSLWRSQPDFLISNAKTIDSLINQRFNLSGGKLDNNLIDDALKTINFNQKLIESLDLNYGGFNGEVKFPSEAMLLYSLDQLRRAPNRQLESATKKQLDNMISGGLYDHINGGFYRYSTRANWSVPHFEKMLYNQAQLIEVYYQAYQYFRDPKYITVIENTIEFLSTNFYTENKGFSSAMDADFDGEEGGYYIWSPDELRVLGEVSNIISTYSVTGAKGEKYGVILSLETGKKKSNAVQSVRKQLSAMSQSKGKPKIDNKILTGWNALLINSLVHASQIISKQGYLEMAEKLAGNLWEERFNLSSGLLSRIHPGYNQKSQKTNQSENNVEQSYLEDYAYLADALISLYDETENVEWLNKAIILKNTVVNQFLAEDGGFYNASNRQSGLSLIKTNDAELLSANAVMINVLSKLDRRLGDNSLKKLHSKSMTYIKSRTLAEPLSHLYASYVSNQTISGSTDNKRYFALDNGRLEAKCEKYKDDSCTDFVIIVKLKNGWHINSNKPLQNYLVPTKIDLPDGVSVLYPEEKIMTLGFQKEALSVYEGEFKLIIKNKKKFNEKVYFSLPLQACSDEICLFPEIFKFSM